MPDNGERAWKTSTLSGRGTYSSWGEARQVQDVGM
jgi:hypothetical protein